MLFMFQNKDKDLLGIYQYGCDPFCVSLLTDRHLKVRSNKILLLTEIGHLKKNTTFTCSF